MKACIILHNMIVEDERHKYLDYAYDQHPGSIITPVEVSRNGSISFEEYINNYLSLKDLEVHHQLRKDLIKHLWDLKGIQQGNDEDGYLIHP